MKKILVTGGAGYIGSHTICDLLAHGFEVISIDNYSRSSATVWSGIEAISGIRVKNYDIDLCDRRALSEVLEKEHPLAGLIHFAAYKSVEESVHHPLMYYRNNLESLMNLLELAEAYQIPHFVFSSSCSVYGNIQHLPVNENTPLAKPESPYAATKQMGEQMIQDFSKNARSRFLALRYFNPVGAHPTASIGEMPQGKPSNLFPSITQTAAGKQAVLKVWGSDYPTRDGTCIRDYIHVMDIARAHTMSLEYLMNKPEQPPFDLFNVGSGEGVSVKEAVAAFETVSGLILPVQYDNRRPGDVISIYSDSTKILKA
ncbi:MAG TPA: UDP-glucose 4-epimerase GalE, partial [Chitinophagaceae bacterium]|nr:UDP-glucose 4-epimerase GalE [Chitinophagaceae bacterium]